MRRLWVGMLLAAALLAAPAARAEAGKISETSTQ
jgi:hypothetical protein